MDIFYDLNRLVGEEVDFRKEVIKGVPVENDEGHSQEGAFLSAFIATREHIKRSCSKYKVEIKNDQFSETAAGTMITVDESDVLLAASKDEKSD